MFEPGTHHIGYADWPESPSGPHVWALLSGDVSDLLAFVQQALRSLSHLLAPGLNSFVPLMMLGMEGRSLHVLRKSCNLFKAFLDLKETLKCWLKLSVSFHQKS